QFVESPPSETQVAALADRQVAVSTQRAWSESVASPQQPSVPLKPSEQFPVVQVLQATLTKGPSWMQVPPMTCTGRLTDTGLIPSETRMVSVNVGKNSPPLVAVYVVIGEVGDANEPAGDAVHR